MYEAIRGILKDKQPLRVVVETAGISYRLAIPLSTYPRLPALETTVHLFLSHIVREDAHTLYAFLLQEERDLFETLISISGIGPKTAAGIIGHMDFATFQRAIASAEVNILSKIPGIGKKTAERLVIEMRDKVKGKGKDLPAHLNIPGGGLVSDAVGALMNLGYHPLDAQKAVQSAMEKNKGETDLGRLITASLKNAHK
jgi:Holliday junction DNA helicase RuvA